MTEDSDTYYSIDHAGESVFRDKASKFIGRAFPVSSESEAKEILLSTRKKFYDASHHCYAYCVGPGREVFRFNDDGEPSGSAGKPIYGQLLSRDISDALVIVVRYFGGTKLGIPGLINAYRQTAADAIENGGKTTKVISRKISVVFRYENMNDVMRIQKEENLEILDQLFDNECRLSLGVRKSRLDKVMSRLIKISNISTFVDM